MTIERRSELTGEISSADSGRNFSSLPSEPLIKIRPRKKSAAGDFKEIWQYRELFFILVWRDLKARYKQTILGIGWAILQPLPMTVVFTVFSGLSCACRPTAFHIRFSLIQECSRG